MNNNAVEAREAAVNHEAVYCRWSSVIHDVARVLKPIVQRAPTGKTIIPPPPHSRVLTSLRVPDYLYDTLDT